jgi:hypothetical protein
MGTALSMADHARALASIGWPVFRCRPKGKAPYREGWQDEATTDPAMVDRLWREVRACNIGLACGHNVWVFDVDGAEGLDSVRALVARHGALPRAPLSRTGASGYHLFFQADARVKNSVGKLAPGIDTRSAGGLVVLPPSVHPDTGRSYAWVRDPWAHSIPPAPPWLLDLLAPPQALRPPAPPIEINHRIGSYARKAVKNELQRIETSKAPSRGPDGRKIPGNQHDTLLSAAIKLGTLVGANLLAEQATAELLLQAAQARGIDDRHARQTIRDGLRYGIAHPREVA